MDQRSIRISRTIDRVFEENQRIKQRGEILTLKKLKKETIVFVVFSFQVRLIDAGFIWTEPHSKRIKVKLTVQKEVAQGAILQQTFIVEFTIFNQICDDCQRVEAKDYWKALVQVRQRVRLIFIERFFFY